MPTIDTAHTRPYSIDAQADSAQCTTTIYNKNASLTIITTPGGYHRTIQTTLELTPLGGSPVGSKIEADFLEVSKNPAHPLWTHADRLLTPAWRDELMIHTEYAYYLATP